MSEHKERRIFVVDDEPIIASTLTAILCQVGFNCTAFTSPVAALEFARCQAPDLVISDVVMPQLSGIELAIQIRDLCPNCKILLFSGQAATADLLEDALKNGHHFEVLSKPVHPDDLMARLQSAFEV
jgi:CheY-like chemotaxis protein